MTPVPDPEERPDDSDENGPAVPDEPSAEAAQEGVQTAFTVDPG